MKNLSDNGENAEPEILTEQIKNKKLVPDIFYDQLKTILEKDEYDLFKTKSKNLLEQKLEKTNNKIQRLLELKIKSSNMIKKLAKRKQDLKKNNKQLKESIIKELDLEVAP